MEKKIKITVAGTGYVGMSLAVLLAQYNHVTAVDIIPEKIALIKQRRSPVQDDYIEDYLTNKDLDLTAVMSGEEAYKDADFVVIAVPTNYDSQQNFFDTSAVETVIQLVSQVNPDAVIVIKSTVPVGYTESIRKKQAIKILFSVRSFSASQKLFTIIYIPTGLS